VFTVDQAYRINRNRQLLRQPVAAVAGGAVAPSEDGIEALEIYCECSAEHCVATLLVLRRDYERLRPEQRQLLVAVDHELDSPVHVTLRTATYEILDPWRP
jgi:hypothetical protein